MRPNRDYPSDRHVIERMVLLQEFSPRRQAFDSIVHAATRQLRGFVLAHWLLLVNIGLGVLVGGAVIVPLLFAVGWSDLGSSLFGLYHLVCGQLPSHSYYLFDYQLALCARNLAIYSALLSGSLAFHTVRQWLPPLAWYLWLVTLVPMAVDGGTQLVGLRESTWELRTVTGALVGLGVCWFLLPRIEAAIRSSAGGEGTAVSRVLSHSSSAPWMIPDDGSRRPVVSRR